MPASDKLSYVLELADQGPALRAALAEEVADLLANWPADYPQSMRNICETLLAKAARDVDLPTRARLRTLLDPELALRVLPRESAAQTLIDAARNGDDFSEVLAKSLGIDARTALKILEDKSGGALAIACKGAHIDRAAFSALALLAHPRRERSHAFSLLDTFDQVATSDAAVMLRKWQDGQTIAA